MVSTSLVNTREVSKSGSKLKRLGWHKLCSAVDDGRTLLVFIRILRLRIWFNNIFFTTSSFELSSVRVFLHTNTDISEFEDLRLRVSRLFADIRGITHMMWARLHYFEMWSSYQSLHHQLCCQISYLLWSYGVIVQAFPIGFVPVVEIGQVDSPATYDQRMILNAFADTLLLAWPFRGDFWARGKLLRQFSCKAKAFERKKSQMP